jgi:hypothetical protein
MVSGYTVLFHVEQFYIQRILCVTIIAHNRGKLISSQNLVIDNNRQIQELEQGKTYRYLGIEESEGIQHQQMKDRLKQEYNRRVRMN